MRSLSFHDAYACRHSGACCNAGWIEPLDTGTCRHFGAHASGGCTIHRASGHGALPRACQQFPRVATISPLGASVTLSAFCPTSASLLFARGPFAITERPSPLFQAELEGMDARDALPPLLREGMLMDWASVARWEALAVDLLSARRHDPGGALAVIESASRHVCATWSPGSGHTLGRALSGAFDAASAGPPAGAGDAGVLAEPAARYFAAHAFACWPMYQGRGIAGALEHLAAVRATLDAESARQAADAGRALDAALLMAAFRQSDLRLRHTAG
ncbi:MAG: hypothetical protein M3R55_05825 [Acidobacteriota bacterium]|nr:hypothetical protein [Acidobacteriota bacterium]